MKKIFALFVVLFVAFSQIGTSLVSAGSDETQKPSEFVILHNFTTGKDAGINLSAEVVKDLERFKNLPDPSLVIRDTEPERYPYYTFTGEYMNRRDIISKPGVPWVLTAVDGWKGADGKDFVSWTISTSKAGDVFRISESTIPDYFQLSWTDRADGFEMRIQVPFENVLKISTCDEADGVKSPKEAYVQVNWKGQLAFVRPVRDPIFSVHAFTCGGEVEYSAIDTYIRGIPFANARKYTWAHDELLFFWHQKIVCKGIDWAEGRCWSYETDIGATRLK
ncbi:hypothetical protein A2619_01915 [candidate division WWE3 bacterium RIFOXYD1_FULL_39_9]|uniref:Uncharacterized protein n=1 Tax=candidate division WWE3 bacterium RIFOXYD1_FULL_39_9 TaxID=1802649 RepID=A0A1F4X744_UNCKA|nr:MAG: hypothetical protein A2619_01915 [candidate division WWE3 bacterium RIFOXYD1_FULL_39_9]